MINWAGLFEHPNLARNDVWTILGLPDIKCVSIYSVGQEVWWISGCALNLQYCTNTLKINFLQHFPLNTHKQPIPLKRTLHCESKCINQNQSNVLSIKHLHLTFQSVEHIWCDYGWKAVCNLGVLWLWFSGKLVSTGHHQSMCFTQQA